MILNRIVWFGLAYIGIMALIAFGSGCKSVQDAISNGGSSPPASAPSANPQTMNVSGQLGAGYVPAVRLQSSALRMAVANRSVDSVWAIPSRSGNISEGNLGDLVIAEVGPDGSFHLELPKNPNYDWVILLIDSTKPLKSEQVIGYVNLTQGSEGLMRLPLGAASENVSLGTLNAAGEDAYSSISEQQQTEIFHLPSDTLLEMAKTDNVFKSAKNIYLNMDPLTARYLYAFPSFGWDHRNQVQIKNQFSNPDPATYGVTTGFMVSVTTTRPTDPDFVSICNKAVSFGLDAPAPIQTQWDPQVVGIYNVGNMHLDPSQMNVCGNNKDFGVELPSGRNFGRWSFGTDFSILTMPSGLWNVVSDASILGQFDFDLTKPFDANGHYTIYVPSVKVDVDGNDTITGVHLKWYRWDSTLNSYSEVTDLSALERSLSGLSFFWRDYDGTTVNGNQRISEFANIRTGSFSDFEYSWKFFGNVSTDLPVLNSVSVSYQMGGVDFFWDWGL